MSSRPPSNEDVKGWRPDNWPEIRRQAARRLLLRGISVDYATLEAGADAMLETIDDGIKALRANGIKLRASSLPDIAEYPDSIIMGIPDE